MRRNPFFTASAVILGSAGLIVLGTAVAKPNAFAVGPFAPDTVQPGEAEVAAPEPVWTSASLAPFSDGPLAEALEALSEESPERAIEALRSAEPTPQIRYVRALAHQRAGALREAAEEFEALAVDPSWVALRDRCLLHGAESRFGLEELEAASLLLAKVPSRSSLSEDARLLQARIAVAREDAQALRVALQPLLDGSLGRMARFHGLERGLSGALKLGDEALALEMSRGLYRDFPLSAAAGRAARRLGRSMTLEDEVARAEALVDEHHRNALGERTLRPLVKRLELPDPVACRAHFLLGKAQRKQRKYQAAIATLTPVAEQCDEPELRVRALYVFARALSIMDDPRTPAVYEKLAAEFPEHSFADDALLYAAVAHSDDGRVERALELLKEAADRYPGGDFAADALFRAFWLARDSGALEEGRGLLERTFTLEAPDEIEVQRARYWLARTQDGEAGIEALRDFALDRPASYYGALARGRLEAAGRWTNVGPSADTGDEYGEGRTEPASDDADRAVEEGALGLAAIEGFALRPGPLLDDPRFQAGVTLLRLGFTRAARAELQAAERPDLPSEAAQLLVLALEQAGDRTGAFYLAKRRLAPELSSAPTPRTAGLWQLAYPDTFRGLIARHATAADVDPDLLQALVREESALDPNARSWAGALGLTQLMPATARWWTDRLRMPAPSERQLLNPDLNVRLGARHLGWLLGRFDGELAPAVAGYNAGGGAAARWHDARGDEPLDAWVEELPVGETRGYVKRVLGSYAAYRLLHERPGPTLVAKGEVEPAAL